MPHSFPLFGLLHKLWGGPLVRDRPPGRLQCLSQIIDPSIEERDEGVPRRSGDLPHVIFAVCRFAKNYVALGFSLSSGTARGSELLLMMKHLPSPDPL